MKKDCSGSCVHSARANLLGFLFVVKLKIVSISKPYFLMNLFNQNPNQNLLPYDGEVTYYAGVFDIEQAQLYHDILLSQLSWESDVVHMFGKRIVTKRKVAWYGDKPYQYTYSKSTKTALPWTAELEQIKSKIEQLSGHSYNSCLANLYHSGEEGMGWHTDAEKEIVPQSAIASVSFGAERKFAFKHKESKETVSVMLQRGSLLVMKGATQTHWQHRLPPTKKVLSARVNLTFRSIVD